MIVTNFQKFTRNKFPTYHISKGIIASVLLAYFLGYLFFDFLLDFPLIIHLILLVYFAVTIFDIFKRLVINIEFDESNKQIYITYYHYFFLLHKVTINYSSAGYLAYNTFAFLESSQLSKGLTRVRFYDERKYIAQVVISPTGWHSDQLEEMTKILSGFAHEFKISPGIL